MTKPGDSRHTSVPMLNLARSLFGLKPGLTKQDCLADLFDPCPFNKDWDPKTHIDGLKIDWGPRTSIFKKVDS